MYVVAYDISDNKRRTKVSRLLEQYGERINYSVFECMLTAAQRKEVEAGLSALINPRKDQVSVYPICVNCYAKASYIPANHADTAAVVVT